MGDTRDRVRRRRAIRLAQGEEARQEREMIIETIQRRLEYMSETGMDMTAYGTGRRDALRDLLQDLHMLRHHEETAG